MRVCRRWRRSNARLLLLLPDYTEENGAARRRAVDHVRHVENVENESAANPNNAFAERIYSHIRTEKLIVVTWRWGHGTSLACARLHCTKYSTRECARVRGRPNVLRAIARQRR